MKNKRRNYGLTLTELIVVVAVIAMLIGIAIPAVKSITNSVTGTASVVPMISAALSSGRAMAAKHQKYAGIRFQQDKDGNQYMIAIINAEPSKMGNLTTAYIAVKGINPVRLPESIGVTDLKLTNSDIDSSNDLDDSDEVNNATTFSIVFSPAGNLVITPVRTRNIDGKNDPAYSSPTNADSFDKIFNGEDAFEEGYSMFIQDDYPALGYDQEESRNRIIVFDKEKFQQSDDRWIDCIDTDDDGKPDPDKTFYINPYTGSIISE